MDSEYFDKTDPDATIIESGDATVTEKDEPEGRKAASQIERYS